MKDKEARGSDSAGSQETDVTRLGRIQKRRARDREAPCPVIWGTALRDPVPLRGAEPVLRNCYRADCLSSGWHLAAGFTHTHQGGLEARLVRGCWVGPAMLPLAIPSCPLFVLFYEPHLISHSLIFSLHSNHLYFRGSSLQDPSPPECPLRLVRLATPSSELVGGLVLV